MFRIDSVFYQNNALFSPRVVVPGIESSSCPSFEGVFDEGHHFLCKAQTWQTRSANGPQKPTNMENDDPEKSSTAREKSPAPTKPRLILDKLPSELLGKVFGQLSVINKDNDPLEQSSGKASHSPAPENPRRTLGMLPTEILAQTFYYLCNDDLFNLPLRLIKSGLMESEGVRRFGQVRIWMEKKGLHKLARISNNPVISQYVTELIFYLDTPCEPKDFSTFARDSVTDAISRRRHWPSLEAKYLAMKKTFDDQQKLKKDGTDLRILVEAFAKLPKAKTITIDNIDRFGLERERLGAEPFARHQPRRDEHGSREDHGTYLITLLIKALAPSSSKPNTLQVIGNTTPYRDQKFFYGADRTRMPISLADLLYTLPSSAYSEAFGEMKKLDLRDLSRTRLEDNKFYYDENGQRLTRPPGSWVEPLARIVNSAVSVTDLTIGHGSGMSRKRSECRMLDIPLRRLLGPDGHTHLRRLELSNFITQQWHLVGSLQACSTTLTDLILGTIHLNQGTWARTFADLKGLFKLEHLEFGKLSMSGPDCTDETEAQNISEVFRSGDHGNASLKWLCGTSETNPFHFEGDPSDVYESDYRY